jgi:hypothetical protein
MTRQLTSPRQGAGEIQDLTEEICLSAGRYPTAASPLKGLYPLSSAVCVPKGRETQLPGSTRPLLAFLSSKWRTVTNPLADP